MAGHIWMEKGKAFVARIPWGGIMNVLKDGSGFQTSFLKHDKGNKESSEFRNQIADVRSFLVVHIRFG